MQIIYDFQALSESTEVGTVSESQPIDTR